MIELLKVIIYKFRHSISNICLINNTIAVMKLFPILRMMIVNKNQAYYFIKCI